jgi:TPR repeat protein
VARAYLTLLLVACAAAPVKPDSDEAACNAGKLETCQALGSKYATGPVDLARAFAFHKRACDGGLAEGCMSVAYMYEHGEHVAADLPRAATLYRKACDDGAGDACYGLALLYEKGSGVPKDPGVATGLVEKGCLADGPYACVALAERFFRAEKELCCTLALLRRACARGHEGACKSVAAMGGDNQCRDAKFTDCPFFKKN